MPVPASVAPTPVPVASPRRAAGTQRALRAAEESHWSTRLPTSYRFSGDGWPLAVPPAGIALGWSIGHLTWAVAPYLAAGLLALVIVADLAWRRVRKLRKVRARRSPFPTYVPGSGERRLMPRPVTA